MGRVETKIACELKSLKDDRAIIAWRGTPKIGSPKIRVISSEMDGGQVLALDDGLPLLVEVTFKLDVEMTSRLAPIRQTLKCEYEVVRIAQPVAKPNDTATEESGDKPVSRETEIK